MNFDKFKDQLGDWGNILKPFIVSPHCNEIYAKLKADKAKGVVICPEYVDTYRAFKECPYEDLKVVFILQDPYPWIKKGFKVADGIAMSCRNTGELQPSLYHFYDGIEQDLYNGMNLSMERSPDLTYLANQGVLLLNTALTVRVNDIGSHAYLWKHFTKYVLNILSLSKTGVVYVFLGDEAKKFENLVDGKRNYKLYAEHPARASHMGRKWLHNHVFSDINKLLAHKSPINWIYDTVPF